MKTKIYTLILFATIFIFSACTSADDDIEMQSVKQEDPELQTLNSNRFKKMSHHEILNILREEHMSNKTQNKRGGGKDPKPYWSAEYSNFYTEQGYIIGPLFVPGTDLVVIWDYPINGEDRIHINGEYGHIIWNIKEPRVRIIDLSTFLITYSNECEEKRDGFFQETLTGKVQFIDLDEDGTIDVNRISAFAEDSDYHSHIKTVLTDAQIDLPWAPPVGECKPSTNEIKLEVKARIKGGVVSGSVEIDGVKYELE